jgi:hypothetical protein
MSGVLQRRVEEAREIERHNSTGDGRNATRPLFGPVAKVIWPFKTAAEIAAIAKTNERTAARWLSGEIEPPVCIAAEMFAKIFPPRD